MAGRYPPIEPYGHGMLDVGDGNLVYWEACGNPRGRPAVVLHGGPGSGCTTGARCVLGLAYAQRHPERVSELVVTGVATGRRAEIDLLTRGLGRLFPDGWARFRDGVPAPERNGVLLAEAGRLAGIPGVLVLGSLDATDRFARR